MVKRQLKTFHNYSLWSWDLKAPIPDGTGLPLTNSTGADPLTKNIPLSFFWGGWAIFLAITWWLRWYSVGLQCGRTRFDLWVGKIPWRRKWHPTPVFLPGKSHGWRSLAGYSPWGCKQSDTTEAISLFCVCLWLNSVSGSGIDPVPVQWSGVLTTGPPGKSKRARVWYKVGQVCCSFFLFCLLTPYPGIYDLMTIDWISLNHSFVLGLHWR